MKILYIHQYFNTPKDAGGTRSYWISKELINNGHDVTMLTTNRSGKKMGQMDIDGINVIYLNIPYNNSMGVLRRLFAFIKFMLLSAWMVLTKGNWDLIIATSTPLTVGFPALVAKKIRRIPYLFEVRDLWPEVPVQMKGIANKQVIRLAYWFEKQIYKNASHIVALSPGMKAGVVKTGIAKDRVTVIPNMSKIDKFWPRAKNTVLEKELGLDHDSFKVVYFGTMGRANGMDYIVDAAIELGPDKEVEFVFMGSGSTEETLQQKWKEAGLTNMHFLGRVPMERLSEIVNLCDVSLVTFKNLPILATNSPNKLFDTLSAGKPLIVNSAGWTKEMVENHNCGLYADVTDPSHLVAQILRLKEDPKLKEELGRNGRKLAESTFDKSILCKQFASLVNQLGQQSVSE